MTISDEALLQVYRELVRGVSLIFEGLSRDTTATQYTQDVCASALTSIQSCTAQLDAMVEARGASLH